MRQSIRLVIDIKITLKSMVEKKAHILLCSWHSWTNKFLKWMDLFENGKHFATIDEMTITYKEDAGKVSFPRVNSLIEVMRDNMEKETWFWFFFWYVLSVQDWDTITLNNWRLEAIIKEWVMLRAITDGKTFFMLSDYLNARWIPHIEDENRFVTTIWKWKESITEPSVGAVATESLLESEKSVQSVIAGLSKVSPIKRKSRSIKW